jgi:hydroxymethylpyrimidine pyrophosphatase-like HAD family hydrolase
MRASPRLVAIDVDGTLIGSDHEISERTVRALAAVRAAGVLVVIASGRPFAVVGPLAVHADWVVSGNGVQVTHIETHTDGGVHAYETTFPRAAAVVYVERARVLVPGVRFSVVTDTDIGYEPGFERFAPANALPGRRVDDVLAVGGERVVRLIAYHEAYGPVELAPLLAGIDPDLVAEYRGFGGVEIGPHGVDKAVALGWLVTHLGLTPADVWAFGDGINDVDMLRWAGRGIAMGNAHESLAAVADEVTLSNDDDGVAVVLERLVRA